MRVAIRCECPHCGKQVYGQSDVGEETTSRFALFAREVKSLVEKPNIGEIVTEVAREMSVSEGDIYGQVRSRGAALARHTAWYALMMAGYSHSEIARSFGRDHTSVIHGCKRIEALRGVAG
jgi:chromosomal replication initiation ATPase DnaA